MESLTQLLGFEAKYLVYPLVAVILAGIARLVIRHLLRRLAAKTETELDDQIVQYLDSAVLPFLLLAVLYFISNLLPIQRQIIFWVQRGLVILGIIFAVLYAFRIVNLLLERVADRRAALGEYLQPVRTLSHVLFVLLAIALILQYLRIDLSDEGVRLVRILGILIGAYVLVRIVRLAVEQMKSLVEHEDPVRQVEAEKRAKTVGKLVNAVTLVLIIGVATMMILSEFGMDIMPIVTGAGIAGLAVGFGAQNLVRDIIGGFFLILEDQVRVGDVVRINGTGGLVEALRLRTTVLRDLHGVVHIFPNGEIKQVSNLTKEWSKYVIDVGVAYKEDVDYVMQVLQEIGEELAQDEKFGPLIVEPLQVLGVDDFGSSQVTIRTVITTQPQKQWDVGRELRRRIKKTFDAKGIEIPFPHVSVYFGEASQPFLLQLQQALDHLGDEKESGGRSDRESRVEVRSDPQ